MAKIMKIVVYRLHVYPIVFIKSDSYFVTSTYNLAFTFATETNNVFNKVYTMYGVF